MIRLKAYLKWLGDRSLIKNVRPADVPINKRAMNSPTYLTKEEVKILFEELDRGIEKRPYQIKKRDYLYAAYMLRAIVHMLYAT